MSYLDLLSDARFATLSAIDEHGAPYLAWVQILYVPDEASVYLLLSGLSRHRNFLDENPTSALMVVEGHDAVDASTALARATFTGRSERVERSPTLRSAWLSRHPESSVWIDFADFAFYRFRWTGGRYVAGFGKIEDFGGDESE